MLMSFFNRKDWCNIHIRLGSNLSLNLLLSSPSLVSKRSNKIQLFAAMWA